MEREHRGGRSGRGGDSKDVQLSKALSYVLRHGAIKERLPIGPDAFIKLDLLLAPDWRKQQGCTVEDIKRLVASSDKQRYALEERQDGLYIRANQGHSIPGLTELDFKTITDASHYPTVVHGTYHESWINIKRTGLSKMGRTHIHFAKGEYGSADVISGMRQTCQVLIYINLTLALEEGVEFVESANGVILSPGVEGVLHPKYFARVVDAKTGQSLL
ncbi:tRNA phosphotransferase 1 isoform 1, putative [Acanthamoeba castellanii str. Neff]|uniref:2'-phosphotransferase n=1 Tax=Acanthamoeba castellanii (strain ATCC 30010 / Neff) TaxID=1257118 RepID=L8HI60_ACACF|nr:tRNA phosphotransferase 1 isoform 1, putative [Acanthamoeba castellanii str. Neff]ELR24383.1 tRNA phosphotransferase 1 isoform 1, putative [Acanthamoeba castellanii str. Neff]